MSTTTERQNPAAEEAVLGALLASSDALDAVFSDVGLAGSHFADNANRIIFEVIESAHIFEDGAINPESIIATLSARGLLERVGGREYVEKLAATVPAVGNARHYAEIVKACATPPEPNPPTITALFERCFQYMTRANAELAAINIAPDSLNLAHKETASALIEDADTALGQIRTRLRGCWLDPDTDEERVPRIVGVSNGDHATERSFAEGAPPLSAQLGRIIPATSRIVVDVSLQAAAPLLALAARTPRVHIEVETAGMDSDEIQKVTEVARDAAEDTAEFFKPGAKVAEVEDDLEVGRVRREQGLEEVADKP